MARLGDYVKIKTGKLDANASSENGQYPFFTCSVEPLRIDTYSYDCECVLVAGNGDLNVKYYNGKFDAYQRTYIIESKDKNALTVPYLYCFLDGYVEELRKQSIGGVIKYIKLGNLTEARIPICSIKKQNEIVENFDKVNTLISLRKQQLSKLDELVKSRFIEMFGDPVSNPFRWSTLTMKQASIRLSDGPFGSNLKSEHYTDEGVRVIRLGNIGCGYFNDEDRSYISPEHYATIKKYTCRAGEIVIATLGDPNLRACIVPDHIEYGVNKSDCVHYIPKAEILNNQFVCQYINCPETLSLASGMVHGQTRSRISSGQLADLPIYLPPMDLQQQFAAFVEQTDKSKLEIQKSLEKFETLKKALMQKYFG